MRIDLRKLEADIEKVMKGKFINVDIENYIVGKDDLKMAKKYHLDRGAFGHALLTMRKRSGLSCETLANKLGVCTNTVSRWENNKILPSPRTWDALIKWAEESPVVDADQLRRAYSKALTEFTGGIGQ
jgi:DNA-binding transcriptional regulator YiaG